VGSCKRSRRAIDQPETHLLLYIYVTEEELVFGLDYYTL
jgi:hypothetical protein